MHYIMEIVLLYLFVQCFVEDEQTFGWTVPPVHSAEVYTPTGTKLQKKRGHSVYLADRQPRVMSLYTTHRRHKANSQGRQVGLCRIYQKRMYLLAFQISDIMNIILYTEVSLLCFFSVKGRIHQQWFTGMRSKYQ